MLTEYIDQALRRARYELIEDDETPYYGEIPELPGVWASGRTLEACRQELKEVIEGWILVSVRQSLDIPRLGSAEISDVNRHPKLTPIGVESAFNNLERHGSEGS